MPARIQQLLEGRQNRVDYPKLIHQFPWVADKQLPCIISPDSDGLLCGLFMSHYSGWRIAGFYDTKIMVKAKGVAVNDCVFLDAEIFRKEIRSIGQHMLMYNRNAAPPIDLCRSNRNVPLLVIPAKAGIHRGEV